MEVTVLIENKEVTLKNTLEETSLSFNKGNNIIKYKVRKTSNDKDIKEIKVTYDRLVIDSDGDIVKIDKDLTYKATTQEYDIFYNMQSLSSGIGFTEYMHALNGMVARTPELGGSLNITKHRPFNADGTIKEQYSIE